MSDLKARPLRNGRCRTDCSGAGFVDHSFPDGFGLGDEFDEFAGGAADFSRG